MNEMTMKLSADLEKELSGFNGKRTEPEPDLTVDRVADAHRKAITKYDQRAAETERSMSLTVSALETQQRQLVKSYQAEMKHLQDEIAQTRKVAEQQIASDTRLANSSRVALEALLSA